MLDHLIVARHLRQHEDRCSLDALIQGDVLMPKRKLTEREAWLEIAEHWRDDNVRHARPTLDCPVRRGEWAWA